MKRTLQVFLLLLLPITCLSPQPVLGVDCSDPAVAAKSFSSAYDFTVSVDENGAAAVTQNITIKNLTSECHVADYEMEIKSAKVSDVSGNDADGDLKISVTEDAAGTKIAAKLNNEVIGKGNSVNFFLRYTVGDLAKKEGDIWSLVAYKISASEEIDSYSVKILVPSSFGPLFSVSPKPDSISQVEGKTALIFGKSSLASEGIFAKFGKEQQISFKFRVPIENHSFFRRDFSIVLPPDTEKQQVSITKIDPRPAKITLDQSGNYLASYQVGANSFQTVTVEGAVRLIGTGNLPRAKTFGSSELASFKSGGNFVQVEDKVIQEKAEELKDPEEIYAFVTSYLSYNNQALPAGNASRIGAVTSLRSRKPATNIDFVDLFVALAKAAGIPTREVFGVAVAENQSTKPVFVASPLNTKSLHVWAEIYDAQHKAWVDVDPTWGNTSGASYFGQDLSDRFALFFSVAGDDLGNLTKLTSLDENVQASFTSEKLNFSPKVDLTSKSDQVFAGFPATLEVTIENNSGVSLIGPKIDLSAEGLTIVGEKTSNLPIIFPFEKKTLQFKIRSGGLFNASHGLVKASFTSQSGKDTLRISKETKVIVKPFFSVGRQQILLLLLIGLLVVGIFASRAKQSH